MSGRSFSLPLIRRRKRTAPEVVAITGASAGVGRAVAREFARHGAHIGLIARGQAGLEAAANEVRALGGVASVHRVDVADPEALQAAAEQIERIHGPLDIWINNAMTTIFAPLDQIQPTEYERATQVTYLGTVWGTQTALRTMLDRDRGTIVQVGSALAYRGIPLQAPYCGAKHAIKGFTESLRSELRARGSNVRLTMVQLPALNTPQFDHCLSRMPRHPMPVKPIFQPEVAARAIWWAAHHRRRELSVGLPVFDAITGNKVAPKLGDIYLADTAIDGQQTDEPFAGEACVNLFNPTDEDRDEGAHGAFDADAARWSVGALLGRHRLLTSCLALAVLAGAGAALDTAGSRAILRAW